MAHPKPNETERANNLRAEYSAIVNYHNDLVKSRFTVFGLYIAAMGFVAGMIFKKDSTLAGQFVGSILGFWISLCLWIIELRSRSLYISLAQRGKDIEHRHWMLNGADWYKGFFSRLHKEEPKQDEQEYAGDVPEHPGLDRPRLAWAKNELPDSVCKYISHRWGLDLLYVGTGIGWFLVFILSIGKLFYLLKCG